MFDNYYTNFVNVYKNILLTNVFRESTDMKKKTYYVLYIVFYIEKKI